MKRITKIEINPNVINRSDYKPEYATYKLMTMTYANGDQDYGCLYPSSRGDDSGVEIILAAKRLGVDIDYAKDGVIYEAPAQIDHPVVAAPTNKMPLCPHCGTVCYGDCQS